MSLPTGYGTVRLDATSVSSVVDNSKTWSNYCAIGKDTADCILDIKALSDGGSARLATDHGGKAEFFIAEELVTLSGATTFSTTQTPDGGVLFGITARVITAIEGCTSWKLGIESDDDAYGATLALTAGTRVDFKTGNLLNPTAYGDGIRALFTAVGGAASFSAGTVRICMYYMQLSAPTS